MWSKRREDLSKASVNRSNRGVPAGSVASGHHGRQTGDPLGIQGAKRARIRFFP